MSLTRYVQVNSLLWLALVLALAGSLKHLAAIFASVDGNYFMGWVQAIAIDVGLFALAYSIRVRKAANRSTRPLWGGVVLFSCISVYGNLAYGILSTTGQLPAWIELTKPFILAASLPVLVLFLSELLSEDRQHTIQSEQRRPTVQSEQIKIEQPVQSSKSKQARVEQLTEHLADNPECSISAAARVIGVSRGTVTTYVKQLKAEGVLSHNGNGWEVVQ